MKALRWHGQRDVRVDNVPEPMQGKGEVKIKVKWCGICGSDLTEYKSGPMLIPAKKPHPRTGRQAPIIMGHEFSGEAVGIGEGVTRVAVGDRVTVWPLLPCYECHWCRRGRYNECLQLATIGIGADGGFAEYVVVPERNVHKLPDGVSYEMGAVAEPLAVAVRAGLRGDITLGDQVVVIGAGTLGLLVLQVARAAGAAQVFVIETQPLRSELATKLGASMTFNPLEVDAGREIAKLTDNLRANKVIECAGIPATINMTLTVSSRAARIVLVGISPTPVEFPFDRLLVPEKEITTVQGYVEEEFPIALSLLASGRVVVEPIITRKIGLAEIVEKGFEALIKNPADNIKILVSPE